MEVLQLSVMTPIDELRNREIKSNVANLLPIIKAKADEYIKTVYTIDQERTCKEHRAQLNKFRTAVSDELKAIAAANNEPFKRFEAEVKPIIDVVAKAIESLDEQLYGMEALWRTRNLENAKILYDAVIGTGKFGSWIPWEKILITKKTGRTTYEDFFGNKGSWSYAEGSEATKDPELLSKAGPKVYEVFEALVKNAQEKLDIINGLGYPEEIKMQGIGYIQGSYDPIKRGFDVDGAFDLMNEIARREKEKQQAVEKAKREAEEEKRRAIEETQRRAEAEKQRAIEEVRAKAKAEAEKREQDIPVQMKVTDYIPNAEEKKYTLRFEAEMTITQAKNLRAFCESQCIKLKSIQ